MIKEKITALLKEILKKEGMPEVKFTLEHPREPSHGDYASNIAFAIFKNKELRIKNPHNARASRGKQEWKNPLGLAQYIIDKFIIPDSKFMIHFEKVEAVAPGFINFWLSKEYLISQLSLILNKTSPPPAQRDFAGRRIMVEFTDPNPFKEFHIGHLYSNVVGEAISRLLEANGAIVKRANYQGDVGMHVAKALYGLLQNSKFSAKGGSASGGKVQPFVASAPQGESSKLEEKSLKEKIRILGGAYASGARAFEDSEKAKSEIEKLNKKIYDKDPEITALYEKGRQWSLEYFETIYKRLGTKFDFYYFESEVGVDGLKLVKEYLKKGPPATHERSDGGRGVFEESRGAVIFPGKKQGLHDRVFITSLGLPTYEAKELGLAFKKYQDFKFDQSIVVTGNEIIGYFKVLLAALGKINPEIASKTKHLAHGMVRLPTGKMSSRSGNIVTGEWLLDETKKLLKSRYSDMEEKTLEKVAVGSVKYALLKSSLGHDIEFNFEESINIQGNSGPYLQYAFARTQSVINKFKIKNLKFEFKFKIENLKLKTEELLLLRLLYRFPEIVEEARQKFAPNILCNYLFELAQKFNLFYQKYPILQSRTRDFRLALTDVVSQVLKEGLRLLGISAPSKM